MATVGIWKICSSLNQVIKYTTNEEKTDINNYKGLDQSLEYVKDDFKTEKKLFVDGINCLPENALKEMVDVKKRFMKTDGVLGWHAYHSYKEGEITPELAHKVGLQVANEMWGDRFQVVVSTHVNGKCIHNHFVINSVSFVDGKKYYGNRTTYAELRRLSNVICNEYGLSTLEEKKTKSGINYSNYQNKSLTYTNYYKTAKEDLDIAISESHTFQEFLSIMKNMGYEVINRSGKLSIRGENYKRNIRIERYFGIDYSIDNITKQIQGLYIPVSRTYYHNKKPSSDLFSIILKPHYNSFYSMYIRYCNILGNYPKFVRKYPISSSMKADVNKLEELSQQAVYLAKNNIDTEEQFFNLVESKESELDNLKNSRENLWKEIKKVTPDKKEDIKIQIKNINEELKTLNNELKVCEKIRIRKESIKENLENLKDKEMIVDEHIR